jgi:CubicO group peptidase (beta-lactamase class C family)
MPPDAPTLTDPALAGYSVDRLARAFCDYTLTRPPGRWEYSNWDTSLLGHLLARRIGMDFEAAIEQRVTRPLGLTSTAVEPTRSMRKPVSHSTDLATCVRRQRRPTSSSNTSHDAIVPDGHRRCSASEGSLEISKFRLCSAAAE